MDDCKNTRIKQLQAENEALRAEIKEGDYWMQKAKEYSENGGCLICFGTDEGGHKDNCYIGQLQAENAELRAELVTLGKTVSDRGEANLSLLNGNRSLLQELEALRGVMAVAEKVSNSIGKLIMDEPLITIFADFANLNNALAAVKGE